MTASVELLNVTKTYGPVRALVGVSVRFEAGQVSMIYGPNGSGQSTLLAILGTLVRPTSGKISHGSIGGGRVDIRAALGWVGHDSLCYVELTGRENIELAARLHGLAPDRAYESAEDEPRGHDEPLPPPQRSQPPQRGADHYSCRTDGNYSLGRLVRIQFQMRSADQCALDLLHNIV